MSDLRVGLGCMRCTDGAAIAAALEAGITLFDTARAYEGNEELLAKTIGVHDVRIVTKGGMRRPDGAWQPDGRARALREDCEASLEALGGLPIDLYLIHAPDPRVPWSTTVRALAHLQTAGLVRGVGLSNVNRKQLDEALALAPIAAVEIALGPHADAALRGGVITRCAELGITVLVHSPLGGPLRAGKLARDRDLASIAARHGVSAQDIVIAALIDLHPCIVPIPGSTRPDTARACANAARIALGDADRAALAKRFGWRAILEPTRRKQVEAPAEIVMLMGIQGSGKSTHVEEWRARGYERLNRDERGGTMRDLHRMLGERIKAGAARVVLDNTYSTRALRQGAIEAAHRAGAFVRGIWLDTPIHEAQLNVVRRMLRAHGRLLEPTEMQRARDPTALSPTALLRTVRDLERPSADEGFDSLESVPFVRALSEHTRAARFVAIDAALRNPGLLAGDLVCVFAWQPSQRALEAVASASVRVCAHPGGPPRCWCRPPLPGLLVQFADEHGVDFERSTLHGTKPLHKAMARAIGARWEPV